MTSIESLSRCQEPTMTTLNAAVSREHRSDLIREAAQHRASRAVRGDGSKRDGERLTLRLAEAADGGDVHRLEALDDTTPLAGRILLAVRDGEAVAALSLTDGHVAANPFVPTQDAVALLHLRAEHLAAPAHRARRWGRHTVRRPRWA
jgi:hypothetical protein